VLSTCLLALLTEDEFTDPVDREAGAFVLAESILLWRKSVTKG
jgi:hypothetical protein